MDMDNVGKYSTVGNIQSISIILCTNIKMLFQMIQLYQYNGNCYNLIPQDKTNIIRPRTFQMETIIIMRACRI